MKTRTALAWVIGIVAVSVLAQVFLITRPLLTLITNLFPDDSFYYFKIAQNLAHGLGSTFDGVHLTNGYHPLWLLILVPIFHFFSGGVTPIRIALALSVVFNAITAFVVWRLLIPVTKRPLLQALGVALWALNPFVLYESLNGLETSLALLFTSLFFLLSLRAYEQNNVRAYVLAGVAGGIMILSRIDTVFYVGVLVLWLVLSKGWKQGLRAALAVAIPAGIVLLPWFAWNLLVFHMLLTSAAGGNAFVNHALVAADNGSSLYVYLKTIPYMLYMNGKAIISETGVPALLFFALGAGLVYLAEKMPSLKQWKKLSLFYVFFAGVALLFVANAGIRWTTRSWYFIIVDLFVALLFVAVTDAFVARKGYERIAVATVLVLTLISFLVGWRYELFNRNAEQTTMYAAAGWLSDHLPAGTSVGIFNAGIIAYFSTMHVVNLDGLVNNSAYDAMRSHSEWNYIQNEHLAYIADFPLYLSYRYKTFFGIPDIFSELTPVGTVNGSAPHGDEGVFTVYRVNGASQ